MRNVKFILSAVAILLTGAIAAGLAARAVTAPDASEVRSAGTVSIPTVLGQTAEEVLFYPWSLYDTETLYPVPENILAEFFGMPPEDLSGFDLETIGDLVQVIGSASNMSFLLRPFDLPAGPVECDISTLPRALEWNVGEAGRAHAGGEHIFLKDFPAVLRDSDTPVTLSMAVSSGGGNLRTDYSFLLRPAQPREITGEEQRAALAQVKEELLDLLLNASYLNYELTDEELYTGGWLISPSETTPEYRPADEGELPAGSAGARMTVTQTDRGSALGWLLRNYLRPDDSYCITRVANHLADLFYSLIYNCDFYWDHFAETPTLDDLLALTADMGLSVQIIATQGQIVVLFSQSGGAILGVYYDIQLGCWSGVGWRAES